MYFSRYFLSIKLIEHVGVTLWMANIGDLRAVIDLISLTTGPNPPQTQAAKQT